MSTATPENSPEGSSQASETTYATAHPRGTEAEVMSPPEPPYSSPRVAEEQRIQDDIPWGVRIAAAWTWRILIILAGVGVAVWLLGHVMLILIALAVAALLSTLLRPLHNVFVKIKFPRVLAAITTILVMLAGVAGILYLVGNEIIQGFAEMSEQVEAGIYEAIDWVDDTARQLGFEISTDEVNQMLGEIQTWLQENQDTIMSGAMGVGSAATNIGIGTVLVLFTLIFFLADGRKIWDFLVLFAPGKHRPAIHGAGRHGWTAVGTYMRVQVLVAFVDAVGIYIGAIILDVPLALPIAVLVFFGGFVPVVGAVVTGAVAVILAWVAHDLVTALIMLGVVILVQQIESNVLQPIIMGKAVKLHPLAVVLAVTAGTTLMGIPGALFAVPVLAFIKRATHYITKEEWRGDPEALEMERVQMEETLKRAAQKEQIEAEEQASLATLKRRIKETLPGLDPDRPGFGWRHPGAAKTSPVPASDQAPGAGAEESETSVPAPRPAAPEATDDSASGSKDTKE
ncbi:AI-2E family transporter [Nesterenkonia flava]|uniref:AI-2E family transporter n=1 Tax=Nesterenkonia flava TaxID=469799 RepID=A0ABU1FQA6_9MICC|nr:AI-2E family transporter [Nesterenkonia flava]MDR5710819.1 AI-2E family transporter [Nesterenkonia flava]